MKESVNNVLNGRKDVVYGKLIGRLEEHNIRIVNFRNMSKKENEHLEEYFNSEIAPFLAPVIVGERQPFPFLKNKDIYAVAVLRKKNGKKKIGIIPCSSGVIPRLIQVGKNSGTYILSEELILHFAPQVFRTCLHKHMRTSFRQILPQPALKILAGRQPACGFLPCLQLNYARKSAHISYEDRFLRNTP